MQVLSISFERSNRIEILSMLFYSLRLKRFYESNTVKSKRQISVRLIIEITCNKSLNST